MAKAAGMPGKRPENVFERNRCRDRHLTPMASVAERPGAH